MEAYLRVVEGKPRGQYLRCPDGDYVFGRGPECHVRPNSDWVSRQHCLLHVGPGGLHIRDLGSTNGTLVNGVRVLAETKLKHGDLLQIGPLVLELILTGLPETKNSETCVISLDRTVDSKSPIPGPAQTLAGPIPALAARAKKS